MAAYIAYCAIQSNKLRRKPSARTSESEVTLFTKTSVTVPMTHRSRMITFAMDERSQISRFEYCRFSHMTSSGSGARS